MYNKNMNIKQYTDENYIPMSDLLLMGENFVSSTKEYRERFMEMIPINDFEFSNIVETPKLVKQRYEKNVEIKGLVNVETQNHDYILALALKIVKGEKIDGITKKEFSNINKKYNENGRDLTIITIWLVKNINDIINLTTGDIAFELPELNKKDLKFINNFNKPNRQYSINEYTTLNSSSYETGRKALERMTNLKLYIKTKLGKKYVYKPTTKLINITKGGSHGN